MGEALVDEKRVVVAHIGKGHDADGLQKPGRRERDDLTPAHGPLQPQAYRPIE